MKNKEKIWEIASKLRINGALTYKGYAPTIIKLMFLKYLSEYENDMLTIDDYKILRTYQNALYSNSLDLSIVRDTCYIIQEKISNLRELNFSQAFESIFRNNDYKELIEACKGFTLPKDPEEIQEIIFELLVSVDGDVSMSSTNTSLAMLAKDILEINENDDFLDCFCGYNKLSMLYNAKYYTGYEIDNETACVSAMVMIMSGKDNFEIMNCDFYEINHGSYYHKLYDKVFSDGPIGMYVSEFTQSIYGDGKKSDYYNVKLALNSLSEKGRAFITVPGNVLFSVNRNYISLRNEILPYLKSVIALPSMWARTAAPTFVLVLEKGTINENVVFIDASNKGTLQRSKIYYLGNNEIGEIVIAFNGEVKEGFSTLVSKEQLKNVKDLILTPNLYIKKNEILNYRSVEVIKEELDLLYNELKRMIEE